MGKVSIDFVSAGSAGKAASASVQIEGAIFLVIIAICTFRLWRGKTITPFNTRRSEMGLEFVLAAFPPGTIAFAAADLAFWGIDLFGQIAVM
jgi:hypothetical protein